MRTVILKITLCLAILGMIGCGIGLYLNTKQHEKSIVTYEELEEYVEINTDIENSEEVIEEAPVEKLINVDFSMDYQALKEINSDFVGWIYYEPLDLSYPIVMDRGDDFYENYTFELEKNIAGAIFMDYACLPNMKGFNTIIYGHNMKNGTMFGSLKKLMNDPSIIESDPFIYVFTEEYVFMYKIIGAYYTKSSSKTYELSLDTTLDQMKEYVEYIDSVAEYRDEEFFSQNVTEDLRLLTLSTCHGLHTGNRTVVHGVLVACEDR